MSKDIRNSIRIFQKLENGKEIVKRIYPKPFVDWRSFCYENAYDLYITMLTEACRYFNVLTPDDLPLNVKFCWNTVTYVPICSDWSKEEKDKIYNDENYKFYEEMRLESDIVSYSDSMFNDAYRYIKQATQCKQKETKRGFNTAYLFDEMLHTQDVNLDYCGCWILRDGSCIFVDTAHHRRFVEEYLGFKELDIEQKWVKISMRYVYTHDNMTNAQWKTLEKLSKKYHLIIRKIGDW